MIAISYRREDSSLATGRLFDRLQAEFGRRNVFMDFDSVPFGVDFRDKTKHALERARVVIAVVGPNWVGRRDSGKRRIDDPTDFVRMEISAALQRGIPVIPVLLDNTIMPSVEDLPEELRPFAFRNALILDTGVDFHHHAGRLVTGIHELVDDGYLSKSQRRLLIMGVIVLLALAAGVALWSLVARQNSSSGMTGPVTPVPRSTETPVKTPATINRTAQFASLPNPILQSTTREAYTANGKHWVRYGYAVLNKAEYPNELFGPAPHLPPCGNNNNSSRSWVDLFDKDGHQLYRFCTLYKPADLGQIWFALEENVTPPRDVYIVINDRQTNTMYKSNLVSTVR